MKTRTLLSLAVAAGLLSAPSAEAKFSISLAVDPAHLWAKKPARVTIRTGTVLPREHGLRLQAVGPGDDTYETTFFDVPNRAAPGSAVPPPIDRAVTVRPSP